ncbi:MAG: hypothetical protein ACE5EI_06485 [Thermodesulfobacteriota bacterium]
METRCPYLEPTTEGPVCGASLTMIVPDTSDIDFYCSTEEHYRCAILLARILRGDARERPIGTPQAAIAASFR